MIYLDNAATTGHKPQSVIKAVNNSLYYLSANPGRSGHRLSSQAAELVFDTRKILAEMFGADNPENVVFTLNCTQAVNTVLKGVLSEGDHVVISDMEHNAVMRPLVSSKINYTAVDISISNDETTLERFEKAITDKTKIIFISAASNVVGKLLPLKEIGLLAKKKGILFGVDAAQAAGVIPIDMKNMNIDFLCIAPHKGLYAPMGTGVLIARKQIPKTIIEGGTGSGSINFTQPEEMPDKFESGTLNLPGIAGIKAGAIFINEFDINRVYYEELNLICDLYEFLRTLGNLKIYIPYPEIGKFVPVLSFNIDGVLSQNVAYALDKMGIAVRAGLHCAPTAHKKIGTVNSGTVRISPGIFNNLSEIKKLKLLIKKISDNPKKYIEYNI